MPWTIDDPPAVAQSWTDEEKRKCVEAANAVLREGGDDEQAVMACIRNAGHSEQPMSQQHFLYVELNSDALTEGRPFDGVAFSDDDIVFWDMLGREVEIPLEIADELVANTKAVIEATRTESGEVVGLPIDAQGHEKGDGAGWIIDVFFDAALERIRFIPKWTRIGRELIGEGIRRFFSPTIDLKNKVIKGGSLTNWPATVDGMGKLMLRPIELESSIYAVKQAGGPINREQLQEIIGRDTRETFTPEPGNNAPLNISEEISMPEEIIQPQETPPEDPPKTEPSREEPPRAEPVLAPDVTAELMREFAEAGKQEPIQIVEAIQRKADELARLHVEDMMEKRQRELEITQLASQYVGGRKYGLPVGTIDLARFLDSLDDAQYEIAKSIFNSITQNGVVEFTERGHGKRLRKRQLPAEYHAALKGVLDAGNTIEDFFNAVDLGEPADYDLSAFIGGNNG